MLTEMKMLAIECDSCGRGYECCAEAHTEHRHDVLMPPNTPEVFIETALREVVVDGWTEDGEGHVHCPRCEPLQLTDDARDERARERERYGLTLFDLEGTPA